MPTLSRGFLRWFGTGAAVLEDFADRLSHVWTFVLLLVLACVVSWKQGYSKPMICLVPQHSTAAFQSYAESICWNSRFIRYPVKDSGDPNHYNSFFPTPFVGPVDESFNTTLYQWIPLILLIQAAFFKLPNIIYYVFQSMTGMMPDKVYNLTVGFERLSGEERSQLGRRLGRVVYNWCKQCENCLPWKMATMLWFVVKILYIVNVAVQIDKMNKVLRTYNPPYDNSTSFTDLVQTNMFENNASQWKASNVFPRAVMCVFPVIHLQNVQKYTLSCQIPANDFLENVYTFVWIWCHFVVIVSSVSLFIWIVRRLVPVFRKR